MQTDKAIHFAAGAFIAAVTHLFAWGVLVFPIWACVLCAVSMAVLAGFIRELMNFYFPVFPKKPLFDNQDWAYTALGGIMGAGGMLIINLLWV